jgi:3-isopropylmalate dehydrogenase
MNDKREFNIAVLSGDGIGPEIISQSVKVINVVNKKYGANLNVTEFPYSANYYLKNRVLLPDDFIEEVKKNYDVILVGPLGDPRIQDVNYTKDILFKLRSKLDLYITVFPVKLYQEWLCPVTKTKNEKIDFIILKKAEEEISSKLGGFLQKGTNDEIASQLFISSYKTIERFARAVFIIAEKVKRKDICLVEKSSNLIVHDLLRRTFKEVAAKFPNINTSYYSPEAITYQLMQSPFKFDVIATQSLFGNILTNIGIFLQGGRGLSYVCDINPGVFGVFRVIQSSFTKIAGHNTANPVGAILAVKGILRFLGLETEAKVVEQSVINALEDHYVTIDIDGIMGTEEVGDYIVSVIKNW